MSRCEICEFKESCTGIDECIFEIVSVGNIKDKSKRKQKKKKMKKEE